MRPPFARPSHHLAFVYSTRLSTPHSLLEYCNTARKLVLAHRAQNYHAVAQATSETGYGLLSNLISSDADLSCIRSFKALNVRNTFDVQSELFEIEAMLEEIASRKKDWFTECLAFESFKSICRSTRVSS